MQTAYWQKIENIFFQAVALPAEERIEFVKKCSGGNKKLFCEVCVLIDKDNQKDCLLDKSLFQTGAKILAADKNSQSEKKPAAPASRNNSETDKVN